MAIQVQIDSVDRTKFIQWKSLKIDNILTDQVDTCSFIINKNYRDNEYEPQVGREIIITDDGTRVFAGYIVRRDQKSSTYKDIEYKIECVDYTRLLQKKLVAETYEGMTVEDIIKAIIDTYASDFGIDYTNVICAKTITKITFNYDSIQRCIQRLSDIVGFNWWIDYNKNLYFTGVGTVSAPFALSDTNGSYVFNSLRIRKDNTELKNTIIVRGGNYYGDNRRDSIEANGVDFIFPLGYKYRNFSASLTGQPLSIGIDFSSDPDSYDALHNVDEKVLKFKEADTPSNGATLSVSGEPLIPVVVRVKDPSAVDATTSAEGVSGEYEHIIVDKKLSSKEEARDRANAELIAYKDTLEEGEFITETSGLEAGQQIAIASDAYGIDETFLIKQVTRVMMTPEVMRYKVKIISTRTLDMIGILQKLLLGQTSDVDFSENEILDLVTSFYEIINVVEDTPTVSKVHNPQFESITADEENYDKGIDFDVKFVAGPYTPNPIDYVIQENSTNDNNGIEFYTPTKWGQWFTAGDTYNLARINLKLYREGLPSIFNVELYAVDGANLPTGSVLSTGSYDGDDLTTDTDGEVVSIQMSEFEIQNGTNYAIVIDAPSSDISNALGFRYNGDTVVGNAFVYSSGSWIAITALDLYYEIYEADNKRVFITDGSRLG